MTNEEQLALLLSRIHISDAERLSVENLLARGIDWNRVLEICETYEIYPIVYQNLKTVKFAGVAPDVRQRLKAKYVFNAFRNQHTVGELVEVLQAFHTQGIPAIPLKGLPLAQRLYKNINLRTAVDMDVLVPQESAQRAFKILLGLGYCTPDPPEMLTELQRIHIEWALVRRGPLGYSAVELHWALLRTWKFDQHALKDLWAEVRPDNVFGIDTLRMTPEWEFLFLAAHAARHHWEGVKWLADIHDLCCVYDIDCVRH
jgi:hypothetical protein